MAQFDQSARYLIKRDPPAFFRWAAPALPGAWSFLGFVDTTTAAFPGEPDRICDTVAEFASPERPGQRRLVDVEVQAAPHPDMLERLGEYAYRLRREVRFRHERRSRKYEVFSLLLNLTGTPQRAELNMTAGELGGAGARLRVAVRTLSREDAADTLARIERGEVGRPILAWVALMHGADRSDIIREWRRLALAEPDDRWRSDHGVIALVFAELADRQMAWRAELGDWKMKESMVIREFTEEARREGRLETLRGVLLRTLQTRFRRALPKRLQTAINAATDFDELSRWFDLALTADSLDAFRAEAKV